MLLRKTCLSPLIVFVPLATACLLGAVRTGSAAVELPDRAPLPAASPLSPEKPATQEAAIPIPQPRPDLPAPSRKPEMFGPPAPPKMLPDPRSNAKRPAEMPQTETACRTRLKALGAFFEEAKPQASSEGCALPFPIRLSRLSAAVDVEPDAVINCAAAEAAARLAADVIGPAAKATFGEDLSGVDQASAYVCRPRNGTNKLSEHAFGNAIDIASFTLSKGTSVEVEPAPPEKNAKFLMAVRKAACGPFKTVLGPGSDADHSRHFHLDLAPRRNGGTFCK